MNESLNSCEFVNITSIMNIVQLSIYIPTIVIGVTLNGFALWIFCFSMKKHTEASIYLQNLALLDFCLVLSLPFRLHVSQPNVFVSQHMCNFLESLYFANMYGSIYTTMFISVDRYIAIKHPFLSKLLRSPKKTLCICIFIWVFVWTAALCIFSSQDDTRYGGCFRNLSDDIWSTHIIVPLEVFGFLIPMTVMLYCTIQIIRTLQVPSSSSGMCEASKANVIRIIISNLAVFLLSFSLSHIGIFLQFLVRKHVISNCLVKKHINLFLQVALCIASINGCLDAITYYFMVKEFRNKVVKTYSSIKQGDNTIT